MVLATLNPMVPFILLYEVGNVCRKALEIYPSNDAFRPAAGSERNAAGRRGGLLRAQRTSFTLTIDDMNISTVRIGHLVVTISWDKTEQVGLSETIAFRNLWYL